MGVAIQRNFGPLDEVDLLTVQDWGRVGRLARERIIARTLESRDQFGRPFAPYSPAYAKAKAAMGAGSAVNLQLSGQMLQGITVEPDETGVTLAFS